MNILVVPFGFPTVKNPNAFIFIWEQCIALHKAGHLVFVLDASPRNYKDWFSKECFNFRKINKEGIIIYAINYPAVATGKFPMIASFCYNLFLKYLVKCMIKDNLKPDIIHAHSIVYSGYRSLQISKKYKVPLVVTEHYSMFSKNKIKIYVRSILNKTLENIDGFICVSNALSQDINKFCNKSAKTHIIPNLVDPRFVFQKPIKKSKFLFFSAGNLIPVKKMDLLIEAFTIAFKNNKNIKLEIAGGGKLYEFLKELITKFNMEDQIILLGIISRKQMVEKLAECDVFAMLSEKETFGIVYREAMAVGRPIVATKNGGIEENWDDMQGLLVPPNDLEAAVNALLKIKNRIDEFDAKLISKRCYSLYSSNVVVEKLEEIYKTAINKQDQVK
jgi:L-malate glycosyltransferase